MVKKLNIGSGFRPREDCDNCDIYEGCPQLTFVCSMDKIPVEDNTYDECLSIHSIEHISRDKWLPTLKEWCRITKPGGKVHIDTPCISRNIKMYLDETWMSDFSSLTKEERDLCSIDGVPNKTLWLNFKVFSSDRPHDIHYGNFDADLLVKYCTMAGFSRAFIVTENPSLIVEAYK